jgi:hypothetical protein
MPRYLPVPEKTCQKNAISFWAYLGDRLIFLPPQMSRHLPGAIERALQERLIHQTHQLQVELAFPARLVIKPRPAQRNQGALPDYRQLRMLRLNHLTPPFSAHRPQAFDKKSRSSRVNIQTRIGGVADQGYDGCPSARGFTRSERTKG